MDNDFSEVVRIINQKTDTAINNSKFGTGCTLATYNGTSVTLDNFKHPITDFLKLHSFNANIGDRVLVAEIGSEVVVIGRVVRG